MKPELLRDIAVFVEVAKAGSFTKAAQALALPKSTVSRRITDLEREAGLRLFKRTTRTVRLTEEGANYFTSCRRLLEAVQATHDELLSARQRVRGHLRITAPTDFGLRLVHGLPAFSRQHPELTLEFEFTTRPVDPISENCDIAIRIGDSPDSSLTAHKLADVAVRIYAAPAYIAEHGEPAAPAELRMHKCILGRPMAHGGARNIWPLSDGSVQVDAEARGVLSFNSASVIRLMAMAGAGLAALPERLCRQDVEAGRLVQVLRGWSAPSLPIYALMPTRLMPAKARAFLEFVEANL